MRPFRQGSLDGLCGVYAVINALELAGAPLRRSQLKEVFHQLTYSLGAATLLEATRDGMDALTLQRAAQLTFGWLEATHGVALAISLPLERRHFRSGAGYLQVLRQHVDARETAVIIAFKNGGTAHWTVVREVAGDRLLLRDSDGLRALHTEGFAIGSGARHFRPRDTLVIEQIAPD